MLARGYRVTACDLSPGMVERARRRLEPAGGTAVVADMRELGWSGEFDLVTCLDDSLNYLLEDEDLGAALEGMGRALRPGGLVVFDLNTLATYGEVFGGEFSVGSGLRWRGEALPEPGPGELCAATIEIAREGAPPLVSRHTQRHHPRRCVERALRSAGLELLEVRGQLAGGRLAEGPDERAHRKHVYLARKEGADMIVAP